MGASHSSSTSLATLESKNSSQHQLRRGRSNRKIKLDCFVDPLKKKRSNNTNTNSSTTSTTRVRQHYPTDVQITTNTGAASAPPSPSPSPSPLTSSPPTSPTSTSTSNTPPIASAAPGTTLTGQLRFRVARKVSNAELQKFEGIVLTLVAQEVWMYNGRYISTGSKSRHQDPELRRVQLSEQLISNLECTQVGDGIDFRFPFAIELLELPPTLIDVSNDHGEDGDNNGEDGDDGDDDDDDDCKMIRAGVPPALASSRRSTGSIFHSNRSARYTNRSSNSLVGSLLDSTAANLPISKRWIYQVSTSLRRKPETLQTLDTHVRSEAPPIMMMLTKSVTTEGAWQ